MRLRPTGCASISLARRFGSRVILVDNPAPLFGFVEAIGAAPQPGPSAIDIQYLPIDMASTRFFLMGGRLFSETSNSMLESNNRQKSS
jgi:hypothetical protein